ncbi:hypothetical protein [Phytoactinopolyspora endophytica]|uniref:hypothetical protein n=1 Tax=Phytoactinopolyspora endophytica TaxID=1642495 RepID=UPI00101DBBCB|nr:hypothetical protein [Phytoactinopolyspora endophytica]
MGCYTAAEAAVVQGATGVMLVRGGATRLFERLTGRDPFERRRAAHRANAEFLSEMGLDPDRVLGPPPVREPHIAPAAYPAALPHPAAGLTPARAVV